MADEPQAVVQRERDPYGEVAQNFGAAHASLDTAPPPAPPPVPVGTDKRRPSAGEPV